MTVSKRLRFEILRRDNHACRYCGATAPDVSLAVDHVLAVALGGSDDPSNLVTACTDCNAGKSSMPADAAILEDVASDALRWVAAIEQAADLFTERARRDAQSFEPYYDAIRSYWNVDYLPDDWPLSAQAWARSGLPWKALEELADEVPSYARDPWSYFCGCCWRRVREIQEHARRIMSDQGG